MPSLAQFNETHPNRLIAALPAPIQQHLLSLTALVCLKKQEVLYEQGGIIEHIYFPCSAVIALLTVMEDGSSVEVATVGNEGFVGLPRYFGHDSAFAKAIVQVPGDVRRMPSIRFEEEIISNAELNAAVRRYANTLLLQVARCAGCNRLHTAEQRCARWLLMAQDRGGTDELPLTQELVAEILGVARPSASLTLQALEKAEAIRLARAKIVITNRQRLESLACECYRLVKSAFDGPLPQ